MLQAAVLFTVLTACVAAAVGPERIFITPENADRVISTLTFPEFLDENRGNKPLTIHVEGNIGTGKSTFLNYMKQFPYMDVIPEPVDQWTNLNGTDVLKLAFADPKRWALTQVQCVPL